jgi:hypothetical protein
LVATTVTTPERSWASTADCRAEWIPGNLDVAHEASTGNARKTQQRRSLENTLIKVKIFSVCSYCDIFADDLAEGFDFNPTLFTVTTV